MMTLNDDHRITEALNRLTEVDAARSEHKRAIYNLARKLLVPIKAIIQRFPDNTPVKIKDGTVYRATYLTWKCTSDAGHRRVCPQPVRVLLRNERALNNERSHFTIEGQRYKNPSSYFDGDVSLQLAGEDDLNAFVDELPQIVDALIENSLGNVRRIADRIASIPDVEADD